MVADVDEQKLKLRRESLEEWRALAKRCARSWLADTSYSFHTRRNLARTFVAQRGYSRRELARMQS